MPTAQFGVAFDVTTYNDLPSVEEANAAVRKDDGGTLLDKFLHEASRVICAHDMETRFGVALLHKHYACDADERTVEYEERTSGERALVTRPTPQDVDVSATPVIWKIVDSELKPLAFSTDPVARELYSHGEVPDAFLTEFVNATRELHAEDVFGLAVVERDLYKSAAETELPLEFTDLENRRSTLVLRTRAEAARNTIETSWVFEKSPDVATTCSSTCRTECWNIAPDGHDVKHYPHHVQVPD